MVKAYALARRLARSDISVLISGETGSGKENLAVALHQWSARSSGPWVAFNCAALPESLAESELFGYERGAFTDARVAKRGLLERAQGGTLFLDEVGELPLSIQSKLLRAVECRRILRLGGCTEIDIDVRFVTATNRDLAQNVRDNRFRSDLLFRIAAASIPIPPLRERRSEVRLLAAKFARAESQRLARVGLRLSEEVIGVLEAYSFPGNVRELKNAIEYAVAVAEGPRIEVHDLPSHIIGARIAQAVTSNYKFTPIADEIRALIRRRIVEALERHDGVQTQAAAAIGMPLRTFTLRMRQYGIGSRR